MMRWRNRLIYPRRGDLLAILFGIAFLVGLGVLATTGRMVQLWNFGFGPNWRCAWQANSEPACFKDPGKAAKPASH
ncbi:MAG TPA: hypothetical protein VKQ73_03545 [Stellaceae bacterium]|nr:hypothetical protein [Stellaceae bacterium]